MRLPQLADFGLDEALAHSIREQDARRRRGSTQILGWGFLVIWVCWSTALYVLWLKTGPTARVLLALLLGLIPAALAALPLSLVATIVSSLLWPRHAKGVDLDRYDEARGHVRTCDVCEMALGDASPKADVYFCPTCDAWICGACRRRYDLRAIAALKRRVLGARPQE